MFELTVKRYFSAAHQLLGYQGSCEELHGHNYKVEVTVRAENLNHLGLALDFHDLKKILDKILERFDHKMLNRVAPFDDINPSAENLARVVYQELQSSLPQGVIMARVTIWESRDCAATYFE